MHLDIAEVYSLCAYNKSAGSLDVGVRRTDVGHGVSHYGDTK